MKFVKTKILATIGPASEDADVMKQMILAGADAFRLNFSHGNYESFEKVFNNIEKVSRSLSLPISILVDLQGPKIRVGKLQKPEIILKEGETIEITTENIEGDESLIATTYKDLIKDARVNDTILLDDGLLNLKVIKKRKNRLVCKIIVGGILRSHKGMNLPGMKLSARAVTEKDKRDLSFALKHRVDFIALSFVRKAEDVITLRRWLKRKGKDIPIIAKIEKPEAMENFDEILEVSDGIMVARGDLGVEMKPQEVPILQKEIIRKCNRKGKLVITATQMLESMIKNSIPTRAEASDVANAVFDGSDVVMLSGETSVGKHPVKVVETMNDILIRSEAAINFNKNVDFDVPENIVDNLFDAAGKGITEIANQVNARAIVVFTHYGRKARVISKFKPQMPLFAFSDKMPTVNRLNLYHGIIPFYFEDITSEDKAIEFARKKINNFIRLRKNEVLIFTAGAPITDEGRRTWIRFYVNK